MKKATKLLVVIFISVFVFGCTNSSDKSNTNLEKYRKVVEIMISTNEGINNAIKDNVNSVDKLNSSMDELKKDFNQKTTDLLSENIKTDVFSTKLNELAYHLTSYTEPLTITDFNLQEGDSDEVTVSFQDSKNKKGEFKMKFQMKDNLINSVIISQ